MTEPTYPSLANEETRPGDSLVTQAPEGIEWKLARERSRAQLFPDVGAAKLDRFTLLDRIGSGAMGTVFAAWDPKLDRRIAVKVLGPTELRSREASKVARARTLAEARAMAKLSHPNVVTVFDVGETDTDAAELFVAMEFVDGVTLREWVARDRPSWRQIVEAYRAAGRGLAAVHAAGLVHRDFKPDNAMIDVAGHVRVMDFGLALVADHDEEEVTEQEVVERVVVASRAGRLAGTPAYMAPEGLAGAPADARADQFAFCVTLYEALWSRRPWVAESLPELVAQMLDGAEPAAPPRSAVPRRVRAAVMRGLNGDPRHRWPDMHALLAALRPTGRGAWLLATVGVGASGLAALVVVADDDAGPPPCRGAAAALAPTWNEEIASELRRAVGSVATPFAADAARFVGDRLDAYADAWIAEHRAACEATAVQGTQSGALLDRRVQCLRRRQGELAALVAALRSPTAQSVEAAPSAIDRMVPIARCANIEYLLGTGAPPADPGVAERVEAIRTGLDGVVADAALAEHRRAKDACDLLVERADALGYDPLRAEVYTTHGYLAFEVGETEQSASALETAYFAARQSKAHALALEAAAGRAMLALAEGSQLEPARLWLRLAEAEQRANDLTDEEQHISSAQSELLAFEGRLDEALAHDQSRLAWFQTRCRDAPCLGLLEAMGSVADHLSQLGRDEESADYGARAVEVAKRMYGSHHPETAGALQGYATALGDLGRRQEAADLLREALAIHEAASPGANMRTAVARLQLGGALGALHIDDEALAHLEAARDVFDSLHQPKYSAGARNHLAILFQRQNRWDAAEANFREELAIDLALYDGDHPVVAIVLGNLGWAVGMQDRWEESVELNTRALAMAEAVGMGGQQLVMFRVAGARAKAELGRHDEALAMLRQALEALLGPELSIFEVRTRKNLIDVLAKVDKTAAAAELEILEDRCAADDPAKDVECASTLESAKRLLAD